MNNETLDHGIFTLDDEVRTLVDIDIDVTYDEDATVEEAVDHGTCTLVDIDLDHVNECV